MGLGFYDDHPDLVREEPGYIYLCEEVQLNEFIREGDEVLVDGEWSKTTDVNRPLLPSDNRHRRAVHVIMVDEEGRQIGHGNLRGLARVKLGTSVEIDRDHREPDHPPADPICRLLRGNR